MTPFVRASIAAASLALGTLPFSARVVHAQGMDVPAPGVVTAPVDAAQAGPVAPQALPQVAAPPTQMPPLYPAAPDVARVLSSTPVLQQFAVPRTVCSADPTAAAPTRSGNPMGALIGGIIGGALGNSIGRGDGRAAATAIGIMGGAILGDQADRRDGASGGTTCTTQTFYETRPVAWNVVYEYAGRQYSAQLPSDPGPWLRLQITPVLPAPGILPPPTVGAVPMAAPAALVAPAPAVVSTVSYAVPSTAAVAIWPAPVMGVSLNLGYSHSRGHWQRPYPHRW